MTWRQREGRLSTSLENGTFGWVLIKGGRDVIIKDVGGVDVVGVGPGLDKFDKVIGQVFNRLVEMSDKYSRWESVIDSKRVNLMPGLTYSDGDELAVIVDCKKRDDGTLFPYFLITDTTYVADMERRAAAGRDRSC